MFNTAAFDLLKVVTNTLIAFITATFCSVFSKVNLYTSGICYSTDNTPRTEATEERI